jgi:uncharacterized protein
MDLEKQPIIISAFAKLDRLLDQYIVNAPTEADIAGHQAFQWEGKSKSLLSVKRPVRMDPAMLLGVDDQKDRLLGNTRRFIAGSNANNVLLWGERGTGKSSLVKSLLTEFTGTGLRIVQVLKHDILTVQTMYDIIAAHPSRRFIIFIDDLSFEEEQTDYQEMKTVMDGGLEQMPDNVLFYATSNRKHLVPTRFSDNDSDDIRPSDTVEEKISLADRFGIRLGFYHMSQETYLEIVDLYALHYGVAVKAETLHHEAAEWSRMAGGRNGRIAEQFVRSLTR